LAQYQRTLWSKPRLTYLFFELTDCCNLSCKHCGSSCLSSNRNYLPFIEAKKVLDQVAKAFDSSQILVCITGGEPLLNKDVFKIISYSISLGYSCGITTNGTLLTNRMCCQLKNAGLHAEDHATGKNGFNLAAVMLLGRDEVIRDICPAYQTDALVRKVNVDRYDDRLTVVTNLVESFEQLFKFATLHLPDKFYVEGVERKSLRNIVAREMLVNTLMHREYSSSYQAKFVIEQDRMFVENANRARFNGPITLRNLEPFPKNPLIASFFRNIGYSEKLGSGARKMFKYGRLYSGVEPEFIEDDVFRIIQPLNENYSFDAEKANEHDGVKTTPKTTLKTTQKTTQKILDAIMNNPNVTRLELSEICGISADGIKWQLKSLTRSGRISRIGGDRGGHWEVHDD